MDKIVDPSVASRAYAAALQGKSVSIGNIDGNAGGGDGSGGVSFSSFLKTQAQDTIQIMRSGEEMAGKAVTGEADITDVVGAVTNAEVTLETVVAVRDRMVSAYQEIMRMPI